MTATIITIREDDLNEKARIRHHTFSARFAEPVPVSDR
jgi:hypothetical protein